MTLPNFVTVLGVRLRMIFEGTRCLISNSGSDPLDQGLWPEGKSEGGVRGAARPKAGLPAGSRVFPQCPCPSKVHDRLSK